MDRAQVINFGAGPSALPDSVLEEATKSLLNFQGTGIGITEISHRSKEFGAVVTQLEQLIRTQLDVPPTHHILFSQGGGTQQFASVVLNMQARHRLLHPLLTADARVMDYVVTGSWSKKAAEEARRLGGARVHVVADARAHSADRKSFTGVPPHAAFAFSPDPVLVYYCENETVDGVQYAAEEDAPTGFPFHLLPRGSTGAGGVPPLVADYSSSFMSRPITNLADHAIIFAGAQKNIGPSGLTILIVRDDCLVDVDAAAQMGATPVPIILAYKTYAESKSLYNTPSTFAMYVAMLVLQRMEKLGGLKAVWETNRRKQEALYTVLKQAEDKGILVLKVMEGSRSWMNVVFTGKNGEVEKEFLSAGELEGFKAMKGHRSVGGMRISLYNAITEEQVDKLVSFITNFIEQVPLPLAFCRHHTYQMGKKSGKNKSVESVSVASSSSKSQQIPPFPPVCAKEALSIKEIESDQIILIPDVLSDGECKRFIKFIEELPLELTPPPKKGEALRVNHRISIPSPSFADALFSALSPHLPSFPYPPSKVVRKPSNANSNSSESAFRPAHSFNSNIRLYKYTDGQHFGCHYDDSVSDLATGTHSEWTLLVYLSGKEDGVVGGETVFYKGAGKKKDGEPPIKPDLQRGMALLHRHGHECLLHEGTPVQKGTKYVLRSDVMFLD